MPTITSRDFFVDGQDIDIWINPHLLLGSDSIRNCNRYDPHGYYLDDYVVGYIGQIEMSLALTNTALKFLERHPNSLWEGEVVYCTTIFSYHRAGIPLLTGTQLTLTCPL